MSSLQGYVDSLSNSSYIHFIADFNKLSGRVLLILQDGRAIVGVLAGYDQKSNVVLSDSKERIYSMDDGVEEVELGLYLVKGDMMSV
jgi:small nuclear ribonucleoprotein (snRNP)-like protein